MRTPVSATNFECLGECLPICPRAQADAAFKWSSGSLNADYRALIPFETITAMANESSKAAINPKVIIPGNLSFPFESEM